MRRADNAKHGMGAGSFNNYQFDFGGLGNGLTKGSSNAPLKDQKPVGGYASAWSSPQGPQAPASPVGWSAFQSSQSAAGPPPPAASQSGWAGYQPMTPGLGSGGKPAAAAAAARSINGIAMRNSSIRSEGPKLAATAGIAGLAPDQTKVDDVFGDLLGAALSRSNAPLNNVRNAPKPSFSMGNLDSSLPKTEDHPPAATPGIPMARMGSRAGAPAPAPGPASASASAAERDPFPAVFPPSSASYENDVFSFPGGAASSTNFAPAGASQSSTNDPFGLSSSYSSSNSVGGVDPFEFGKSGANAQRMPSSGAATPAADPFDVFNATATPSSTRKLADPLESLLFKSTPSPAKAAPAAAPVVEDDGWGMFGGGASSGGTEPSTTELEGLPPPPLGVTATAASEKGSDFYKTGQFPDAIKWLSWSVELMKRQPDQALLTEVLTHRVSCYKEIGEMKKAVADCTQAIELQPTSTSLIMLRSNLYESMEKYKLGVADLKLVLKIDRDHRQARATLTRLERMIAA